MGGAAAPTNRANVANGPQATGGQPPPKPEAKPRAVGAGRAGVVGGELPSAKAGKGANTAKGGNDKVKYFIRNLEVFTRLPDGRMRSLGHLNHLPPRIVHDMKSHPDSIRLLKPTDKVPTKPPVRTGHAVPNPASHDDLLAEVEEPEIAADGKPVTDARGEPVYVTRRVAANTSAFTIRWDGHDHFLVRDADGHSLGTRTAEQLKELIAKHVSATVTWIGPIPGEPIPGEAIPATALPAASSAADKPAAAAQEQRGSVAGDLLRSIGAEILDAPHKAREAMGRFGTALAGAASAAADGVKDAYHEMTREPTAKEKQEEANRRSIEYLQEMDRRHKETAEEQQAIDKFLDGAARTAELITVDVECGGVDDEVKKELPTYHYLTRHPGKAAVDTVQIAYGAGREIVLLPEALVKKADLALRESAAKGADELTKKHGYDHHDQFGRVVDGVKYEKTHRPIDDGIGAKLAFGRNITDSPVYQFMDKHQDDITLIIREGTKATITGILIAGGVPSPAAKGIAAAIAAAVTTAAVDLAKDKDFAEIFKDAAFDGALYGAAGYVGGRWQDKSIEALTASRNMALLRNKVAEEALATLKAKSPDVLSKMSATAVQKLVDDQARRAVAATVVGRVAKAGAGEGGQMAVKALGNLYKFTTVSAGPDGRLTVRVDTKRLARKEGIDAESAAVATAVGLFEPELMEGARGVVGQNASRFTEEVAKEQAKGVAKHQAKQLLTADSEPPVPQPKPVEAHGAPATPGDAAQTASSDAPPDETSKSHAPKPTQHGAGQHSKGPAKPHASQPSNPTNGPHAPNTAPHGAGHDAKGPAKSHAKQPLAGASGPHAPKPAQHNAGHDAKGGPGRPHTKQPPAGASAPHVRKPARP